MTDQMSAIVNASNNGGGEEAPAQAPSHVASVEQETREALSTNRLELAEKTAKINAEPDLSADAKERYVARARQAAQEKYADVIDNHDKAVSDVLEQNERRLFSLTYPKDAYTDGQKEAHRAAYRQAALQLFGASGETVSRAMSRAFRTGDSLLAQACYHESIERGLSEVGEEYRQRNPKSREAWNTYVRDRQATESRESALTSALIKSLGPEE